MMARAQPQLRFWILFFLFVVALFWLFKPMLLPFAAGVVISYFLDPVVEMLSKHKIPRWLSSFLVLAAFVSMIVLVVSLVAPILRDQIGALINAFPSYVQKIRGTYTPWIESWLARFSPDIVDQVRSSAGDYISDIVGFVGESLKRIISGGIAIIDVLALAIITPIVSFYILRDWPSLTAVIDKNIPRRYYNVIRRELHEIDETLSGFLRGQSLVCIVLGLFYTIGLWLTGLQYGLSIGVLAGFLSFIPYVGTGFAWVCSIIVALVQFDHFSRVGFVLAVLYGGHILEAYVLGPRLIGHRVGLHPVWILFALIAGAKLMGFLGLLIAVPTAAVIGVLFRFGLRQYRSSVLYKDAL